MSKKESSGEFIWLAVSSILFLILLILKIFGGADWPWWCVLSPFWISIGLLLLLAIPAAFILSRQESEREEQSLKLLESLKEDFKEKDEE